MAASPQIPDVKLMTILACKEQLRIGAVLEHLGCAPFAGDHGVETQMPPEVIGEVLRSSREFPLSPNFKCFGVHDENSARSIAVSRAESIEIDTIRSAVGSVWPAIPGAACNRFGVDDFHDF